jgi:hypothetical protein
MEEPIRDEIFALEDALLAAVQAYAADTIGTAIAYTPDAHPYWYIDTNGNGTADPDEVNSDNRYATWTPTLLRTAYNYQYSVTTQACSRTTRATSCKSCTTASRSAGGAGAVATSLAHPSC